MAKASGSIDLKSLKVAGEPNKYVTFIDTTSGVRVYDGQPSNQNVNFAQVNSSGLQVYKGGTATTNKVAEFGETVTIGKNADGKTRTEIDANGMRITRKAGTADLQIANLGYGAGNSKSGTANAPYYTLGIRLADSAVGNYSLAEGVNAIASGYVSHAEGFGTIATADSAHAEGELTYASGEGAHAEGYTNTSQLVDGVNAGTIRATANGAHAEGCASDNNASAGIYASGKGAHAEGYGVDGVIRASGRGAHAEGGGTNALGDYSHAQNYRTNAYSDYQTALGKYNVSDYDDTYAVIIGNGTSINETSNAFMVDWDGYIYPQATKMTDFVVEQGTDGIWAYRKWNSGIAECWGNDAYTPTGASAWGSLYYCTPIRSVDFPSSLFIATPVVNVFHIGASTQGWATTSSCGASTLAYYLVRPNSSYGNLCTFSIKASGRWK